MLISKVKKSLFRLQAQNLYLTYPHCGMDHELAIQLLTTKLTNTKRSVKDWLICTEPHADGTPHLHVVLWLSSTVDSRNAHFADLIVGNTEQYHGHYEAMKYEHTCVTYVVKYGDWTSSNKSLIEKILKKKKKKTDAMAIAIQSGTTLRDLAIEHPGFVMTHLRVMQQYQTWFNTTSWTALPLPQINFGPTLPESQILRWIALNLYPSTPRPKRSPQLFLHGTPGSGKSSLISCLEKSFKTFKPSYEIHWWDNFDDTIELIVFDEFKGQVKCTFMNQILDGQTMIIPRRGGDFTKTINIPVIVCSNYAPSTIYNNTDSVEAFLGRLQLVSVNEYFNIFFQENRY